MTPQAEHATMCGMDTTKARARHLLELIRNGYRICDWPEELPQYASIVGDPGRPWHAPQKVVLHDTPERPCPEDWPWMACFDLNTGLRFVTARIARKQVSPRQPKKKAAAPRSE